MMSLRSRLDRLEQRVNTSGMKFFPLEVLYGIIPTEQLDDETRLLVESLFERKQAPTDPVEYAIANPTSTLSTQTN